MLYKQIEQNKRNSWIIMGLFTALLLVLSIFLGMCFTYYVGVGFFIIGIIYLVYVYFDVTRHLMKVTNAQLVTKESNPRIYELVEELCLAGGIPIPAIYITPDHDPNAFATGRDPEHASLALTQGLLEIMNEKEVQGVIGHELSHIRNYDTRMTVIASAMVNLIFYTGVGILLFGWALVDQKGKGWLDLLIKFFGLLLIMIGAAISIVGIPLSKLLMLLMSRQREYLADVGSVDLTREPSGLISALKKLEQLEETGQIEDSNSSNMMLNNLYFNFPGVKTWYSRLFCDHPPLDKRIKRLEDSDKIG